MASTSSDYAAFVASGVSMSIPRMFYAAFVALSASTYAAFVASVMHESECSLSVLVVLYALNHTVAWLPTACLSLNCYCA